MPAVPSVVKYLIGIMLGMAVLTEALKLLHPPLFMLVLDYTACQFWGLGMTADQQLTLVFEPYRLYTAITYIFVHGDLFHILFNVFIIAYLGSLAHAEMGTRRFLVLFFLTGIAGGVAHQLLNYGVFSPLIGASGAGYGLFGAGAYFLLRHAPYHSLRERRIAILKYCLFILAINFVFAFMVGNVSWEGHLGGFIAGLILFPFLRRQRFVPVTHKERPASGLFGSFAKPRVKPAEIAQQNVQEISAYVAQEGHEIEDLLQAAIAPLPGGQAALERMDESTFRRDVTLMLVALNALDLRRELPFAVAQRVLAALGYAIQHDLPKGTPAQAARLEQILNGLIALDQHSAQGRNFSAGDHLAGLLISEALRGVYAQSSAPPAGEKTIPQPAEEHLLALGHALAQCGGWWPLRLQEVNLDL